MLVVRLLQSSEYPTLLVEESSTWRVSNISLRYYVTILVQAIENLATKYQEINDFI